MNLRRRRIQVLALGLASAWVACGAAPAAPPSLKIGIATPAPPMAFHDEQGRATGFSVEVARAVCHEIGVECLWIETSFQQVIEDLKTGRIDVAAMSLMSTPERRAEIILARPYFRSVSVWLARPGVPPGRTGLAVAVVEGSAQARYARARHWTTVPVATNVEVANPVLQRQADALLVPMMTALNLLKQPAVQKLGLVSQVMPDAELSGAAAFGISPKRPDLKPRVDAALEKLERNGTIDRINSQFLPFKVN